MLFEAVLRHFAFAVLLALLSAAVVQAMIAYPILDHPTARSAHTTPIPRGGGLGIVIAFLVGMVVLFFAAAHARLPIPQFAGVIAAAVGIAAVSLWDDVCNLRYTIKLAAQGGAALIVLASGLVIEHLAVPWLGEVRLGWFGPVLTLMWIIGCTNAVNFMDGLDGLVGGAVLLAALILCIVAATEEGWFVYAAALFLCAGLSGFLPFNLHPARIFLGDVGSQFLGFVMAVLAVVAARFDAGQVSFLIVPLLLFGLLFDAAFTVVRRALMGQPLTVAHRTHLYQLAQRSGLSVWTIAAVHWGFVLFHGVLVALFLRLSPAHKPLVVLPALLLQGLWLLLVRRRMHRAGLSWQG